jgi:hypothetical protein
LKVYFLAAVLPAENPFLLPAVMNWAAQNNFKVAHIVNTLMPGNNGKADILKPSNLSKPGQMSVAPMNMIYIESTAEAFREYFGFEYDESKLPEIMNEIAEKQKAAAP